MYLSRLTLNPRAREVQRDLGNAHAMHQRLLHLFPDQGLGSGARSEFNLLHRLETSDHGAIVLAQSRSAPNWETLPDSYLASTGAPNPATTRLEHLLSQIVVGRDFYFRVRVNPTKRTFEGKDKRGRRVELCGQEALVSWLNRKSERHGFRLHETLSNGEEVPQYSVSVTEEPKVRGWRDNKRMTFGSASFNGVLRVTDEDALRAAVLGGLGTGKAYGFGLLSLAPLATPSGPE